MPMPTNAAASFLPEASEDGPLELRLIGHLTLEQLDARLAPLSLRFAKVSGRVPVVVDCSQMTGYDTAARRRFVDWNRQHKTTVSRLGIVIRNPLWKMVISAMSLASGEVMRSFASITEARAWVSEEG